MRPDAVARGTLSLLNIPHIFTQDDLLTTGDFLSRAKDRGHSLSLDGLGRLHEHQLLVPLYRVSDKPVEEHKIDIIAGAWPTIQSQVFSAAAGGRLRDSADEGYSEAWPYRRPVDEQDHRWWNGFIYSSWQLLHVGTAIDEYHATKNGLPRSLGSAGRARERKLTLALAALSTRYLPGVLGKLVLRGSADESELRQYRAAVNVADLLAHVQFEPHELQNVANALLGQTSSDPLQKWLKLLRYASYNGWSQLRGEPLDAMWRRAAAEILLRAHEDLAAEGIIDALPDLTGAEFHSFQHDRLTPRYEEATTLERALAELGLSPYPKVLLLVEGETEMCHVPRLLTKFGITQPQDVRVQRTKGSKINAHLITRYGVSPRIGRKLGDGWLLDATLTALVIAMDPENHFATRELCDKVRRDLQNAVREEVEYQDATINQGELDHLIHVRSWGEDKYELANFTDDELIPAVTSLAQQQHNSRITSETWEDDLRAALQETRAKHLDIKSALGRVRVRENKVRLAELLWPVLQAKCESEYTAGVVTTPVLRLVLDVQDLAYEVQGVRALSGDHDS